MALSSRDPQFVAAIDQGTSSTRCIIFDRHGTIVASEQREHDQIFPRGGWVEHDATQIWVNTRLVCAEALAASDLTATDIAAVGITNQRETTIVWDKNTGEPIYNGIVWQDTRTSGICHELAGDDGIYKYQKKTGLPLSSYSSGPKIKWILDNVDGARAKAEKGDLLFGTPDTWILWNLTGGANPEGEPAVHATDVTNASRTLLMDINTLQWDEELCDAMGIPMSMLPEIRPSSGEFGVVHDRSNLAGVPITGILGDQQAAIFGELQSRHIHLRGIQTIGRLIEVALKSAQHIAGFSQLLTHSIQERDRASDLVSGSTNRAGKPAGSVVQSGDGRLDFRQRLSRGFV